MSTMRALAVAVVVVLLAADTPPGCAAPDNRPKGPPTCLMKVSREPALYRRTGADDEIRGSVAAYCTPSPRRHLLSVWLTHEFPAGQHVWVPRGDVARSSRLPDAHGFDVTAVVHGCLSGRWRVQAKARGTAADGTLFGPVELPAEQSPAADIKCQGPKE